MRSAPALVSLVLLLVVLALPSSALAAILIEIDKSTQTMEVSVDGAPRWSWPVSTGRSGYATPSGAFRAFRMEEDHYSKEWDDAPMPHSIFFTTKGHAIHGSYETRRIGSPASHGCVRLAPANAERLFALVKAHGVTNTKVVLSGSEAQYVRQTPQRATARAEPREADPLVVPPPRDVYARDVYGRDVYARDGFARPRRYDWAQPVPEETRGYPDPWQGAYRRRSIFPDPYQDRYPNN